MLLGPIYLRLIRNAIWLGVRGKVNSNRKQTHKLITLQKYFRHLALTKTQQALSELIDQSFCDSLQPNPTEFYGMLTDISISITT